MKIDTKYFPKIENIVTAANNLKDVAVTTPLQENLRLSRKYGANVFLKREDLQIVRSYKIRGAFNKISSLSENELANGVVTASAGNHAQGVAYSCNKLEIRGTIFMPAPTPKQKIEQVKMFGGSHIEIVLIGDTFDDAAREAQAFCESKKATYVPPFDDQKVIEGQGTIGLEILNQYNSNIDYLILPVGGGGLAAGVSAVFKTLSPKTKIIGIEPTGAPSMSQSIAEGKLVTLDEIEKFVDGAAVKRVGALNFEICKDTLHRMETVAEGCICQCILNLYNKDAIVVEPAGALTIAALNQMRDEIKNKNVVCLISGSNNDITRTEEIKERALLHRGLKHYFVIRFPQRAGALKEFVSEILGAEDDITYFQYSKKHNRENGPAVVGIELKNSEDLQPLMNRLKSRNFFGEYLNEKADLMDLLI